MAVRNPLVKSILELCEASEVDEVVRFNPKTPPGVKKDPEELRKSQASMIRALKSRVQKGTSKDPESDKFRLGTALRDAGAKKSAAKLGQGEHPSSKEPPEHKEPEHKKHARDAEAASSDADSAHLTHDVSADDAFTAMHAHMTAIKAHQKAMDAAKAGHHHSSIQHHQQQILKHAKHGKAAQTAHKELSTAEKAHAANESFNFDRLIVPMNEQRRLMGFDDTPTRQNVVVEGDLGELNKILRTDTEHQRLLMGLGDPYPTLQESLDEVVRFGSAQKGGVPDAATAKSNPLAQKDRDWAARNIKAWRKSSQGNSAAAAATKQAIAKKRIEDTEEREDQEEAANVEMKLGIAGRMGGHADADDDDMRSKAKKLAPGGAGGGAVTRKPADAKRKPAKPDWSDD